MSAPKMATLKVSSSRLEMSWPSRTPLDSSKVLVRHQQIIGVGFSSRQSVGRRPIASVASVRLSASAEDAVEVANFVSAFVLVQASERATGLHVFKKKRAIEIPALTTHSRLFHTDINLDTLSSRSGDLMESC